jgi:hypothetical protein
MFFIKPYLCKIIFYVNKLKTTLSKLLILAEAKIEIKIS